VSEVVATVLAVSDEPVSDDAEPQSDWQGYGRPPLKRIPRMRFGFERDGRDHPVAWFDSVGDNIHWGSSTQSQLVSPDLLPNGAIPIQAPEDIEQRPLVDAHSSYHESGLRHLRIGDAATTERGWLARPADLREPTWLATLTTRRADHYPAGRSMGRRGAAPLRIPLDDETLRCRYQFEFWLAPPGEHTMPLLWKYWLAPTAENVPVPLHICSRSITPHLVLIIKYGVHPPGGFSDLTLAMFRDLDMGRGADLRVWWVGVPGVVH
jgi:hypothetical protein